MLSIGYGVDNRLITSLALQGLDMQLEALRVRMPNFFANAVTVVTNPG